MTLPSTDLLYLREDEREWYLKEMPYGAADILSRVLPRLIECRKNSERRMDELEAEIERLQIASGEVMPQSIGDEVI